MVLSLLQIIILLEGCCTKQKNTHSKLLDTPQQIHLPELILFLISFTTLRDPFSKQFQLIASADQIILLEEKMTLLGLNISMDKMR